jgi:peptidoglycan DL-endopeptidase CwlO
MRAATRNRPFIGALVAIAVFFGSATAVSAGSEVDQKRSRVEQIADELDRIGDQIDQLDLDYHGAMDRKDQLDQEVEEQAAEVAAQEAELGSLEVELAKLTVDRFVSGGTGGVSPLFTDSSSFSDSQQRDEFSSVALDTGSGDADEMQAMVDDLNREREELESKRQEQADLAASLQDKQEQATDLQGQYQTKLASAQAELGDALQREQERREAEALAAAKAEVEANLRAAQAAAQQRAATPSVSRGGGTAPGTSQASTSSSAGSSASPAATASAAPEAAGPSAPAATGRGSVAVGAALSQQGVPYRFAASEPGVAFDCSGLTKYAWGQAGVGLPHQSAAQYASTPHVSQSDAAPGDLIFYYTPISHVGIYLGGGSLVHAPRTGDVVKVAAVNWSKVIGVSRPG